MKTTRPRGRGLAYALWAGFVATIAVSGVVLLRACGLWVPVLGWNFCPATPVSLTAEAERSTALTKLIRQLQLELAQKNLECASIPPPPPPAFELPTQAGPPRPQQTAALRPPPPPPVLSMPTGPTNDYTFLKGCWRTDPFRHRPNQPTPGVSTYCFDEKGSGSLAFGGPYTCRMPAHARYSGSDLIIRDSDTTNCSDGVTWSADNLICRRSGNGVAQCSGTSGTGSRWTVRLHRM